jgi:hypothetical protein
VVTIWQAARQRTSAIDTSRVDEQPRKEHKGDEGDEGARGLAEHVADGLGVGDRADEGEAGSPTFVAAVAWAFCAHKRNGGFPFQCMQGKTCGLRLCAEPSDCGSLFREVLHAPRMSSEGKAQQLSLVP